MSTPEELMKQNVENLRKQAYAKIEEATKATYAWFVACEVGEERCAASDIYSNIHTSTRVGPFKKDGS